MRLVEGSRALVRRREVLQTLVMRDLKVRYASSVLGYLWSVLDPLAMAAVYWFVFVKIFERGDVGQDPYIVFLVVGLFAWQWFSSTVSTGAKALLSESRLVRSTSLPRELWVVRVVLSKGVEFFFTLPVIVFFVALNTVVPTWRLVFFPLAIVLQGLMLTGIIMILAPVTALLRDTQRLVSIVLRVAFYLTPIIYSIHSERAEKVRDVLMLNPMTGVLELYRSGFFAEELHLGAVLVSVGATAVLLVVGSIVFARLESAVLKEL
jgi:ABC-2 type transport system permease protein